MYVYIYIHIVIHIQFPSASSPMLPCPVVPGRKEGLRQAGRPPATQAEGAGRNAGGHWVPRPHKDTKNNNHEHGHRMRIFLGFVWIFYRKVEFRIEHMGISPTKHKGFSQQIWGNIFRIGILGVTANGIYP